MIKLDLMDLADSSTNVERTKEAAEYYWKTAT